jgi:hypothetical protein
MISSLYANNEKHADQLIETYGQYWEGYKYSLNEGTGWDSNIGWYVTFIRPWAKEFLKWSQDTYGKDNVYFLTMGTADYIFKMNSLLKFDIENDHILTREDIHYPRYNFDDSNNVLVDNENYQYHSFGNGLNKVNFLSGLPPQKLVQVKHFDVRYFKPKNDNGYVEHVKKEIIKAFDWKYES